jgi:GTPase SAR1 family protein
LPHGHSFIEFLGKKILIIGDVGAGKTKLTLELISQAIESEHAKDTTIIDMAPATKMFKERKIGGRLIEMMEMPAQLRYLTPEKVETPRLSAEDAGHLLHLIKHNHDAILPLLQDFVQNPSTVLFINDISIFFQSGSSKAVLSTVEASETFIANGYYGKYFAFDHDTGVSKTERDLMDLLASKMDKVIAI